MENKKIVTRFPPSPTGLFHIGNARTFLFNYLFTKQNNGQIVFRLEDTDKERSKQEYAEDIIENIKWLGIEPDFSTTVKQSERTEVYKKYILKLISDDKAYVSKEKNIEVGKRDEVIRFRNPNKKIVFNDLIRGDIEFDTTELNDFVIAKSLEEPIYHLAVVIDDFEMGVTHVLRGDDGISNTPRQILIQEAIGAPRPIYAHLPLMIDTDKAKLSKRKHGEKVSVSYYKNMGYLPEAVVNFLALVGWNPGTDQEIWEMEELIKVFDIKKVQKGGGVFNPEKLDWINKEHIKRLSAEDLQNKIFEWLPKEMQNPKIVPIIAERISKFGDIKNMLSAGELDFFFKAPEYNKEKLIYKTVPAEKISENITSAVKALSEITENDFTKENIKEALMKIANNLENRGELLHPIRMALSGLDKSPDPFIIGEILGKNETISRLQKAI